VSTKLKKPRGVKGGEGKVAECRNPGKF